MLETILVAIGVVVGVALTVAGFGLVVMQVIGRGLRW